MIWLNNNTLHDFAAGAFTPDINMIAGSLSHINRFSGHVGPYSVALHSVFCSQVVDHEHKLAALLHDASECYVGDLVSPLKALCPEYRAIELKTQRVINSYYMVDSFHDAVKEADMRMLITEAKAFRMPLDYFPLVEPYDDEVVDAIRGATLHPGTAKNLFLKCFKALS